jgi:hypothetical protein
MITFGELLPTIKNGLIAEKQNEILRIIKKPLRISPEEVIKQPDCLRMTNVKLNGLKVELYAEGAIFPVSGYPDMVTVNLTALYKRLLPLLLSSLTEQGWIKRIITLLALKFNYGIWPKWFKYAFELNQALLKDEYYCEVSKEVKRVLQGNLDENILNAVILVIEYDSAYRYRLQDILGELDKSADPIKEVYRLLDLLLVRDDQDTKWTNLKKVAKIVLLIPSIKKKVISILKDINIDKIKFTEADIYWTNMNTTRDYRGMSLHQRRNENIIKYGSNPL